MQGFFSKFRTARFPITDTPLWALEKIRDVKEQRLSALDLSLSQKDKREKLTKLPDEILKLPKLTSLKLSYNRLSTLPDSITQLEKLTHLDLSNNGLITFPDPITRIKNLVDLDLSHNQLSMLPESIGQLQYLRFLILSNNQLSIFPESIAQLQNLISLHLNGNQLNTLPNSIVQLQNMTFLDLSDNPLISPPIEIAKEGLWAVREYFRQLDQAGVDYIYEAKMLILGEGEAGKTTFAHKILDTDYFLKKEDSTKGVDVLKWSFPIEENKQFKVNIWDFGGQEIYHATHQFFLTKRSLYALVADSRKDNTDFYYWLNIAELLSNGSPLLIIKNEKEDRLLEINDLQLKGQFNCLKEVMATNLATNRGLEEIKEEVKHYLKKLPHIGSPLPKTWARVREQLEKNQHNYISLDEYLAICKQNGFTEINDSLQLSGYLHDIGVFLHFQDEPLLKKTVILKPKWGTDAVYKVLDNQTVIRNLGRFTRADLVRIWDVPEYETMRDELLQLMIKFKLCYEIPNQREVYIAPQLLTEKQPDYKWDKKANLLLRYSYDFMPKGILTQFIVVMNRFILEQKIVWKSGVVIEEPLPNSEERDQRRDDKKDRTYAEVIEDYGKREIRIRVVGGRSREWMTVIRHELEEIHNTYRRLKYSELIQCNCPSCKENSEPHFYSITELYEFKKNGQLEIQCHKKPYNMVDVMGLLGDVIITNKPLKRDVAPSIIVEGNYYVGDNKMTEINQHIEGSTIYGSVVAAESIKDSFNVIDKADIKDDLKEQLKQLNEAVEAMVAGLPKEKAEEVADDMKRLAEEAVKPSPSKKWYSISIDGLTKAAENLGKVGEPVIKLAGKVLALLAAA